MEGHQEWNDPLDDISTLKIDVFNLKSGQSQGLE